VFSNVDRGEWPADVKCCQRACGTDCSRALTYHLRMTRVVNFSLGFKPWMLKYKGERGRWLYRTIEYGGAENGIPGTEWAGVPLLAPRRS
jgi:hypothetical protein